MKYIKLFESEWESTNSVHWIDKEDISDILTEVKLDESFSEYSHGELVTYLSYDRFENLISNGDIEEISDAEFDTLKDIVESNLMKPFISISSAQFDDHFTSVCISLFYFTNIRNYL